MASEKMILGVIDAQRGFMPATEGERLGFPATIREDGAEIAGGFGELAIQNGEQIVPLVNRLLGLAAARNLGIFTTQDSHPPTTAHFAKDGGTWPVHCVAFTDGEKLHPEIVLPGTTQRFVKGDTVLEPGEEDTSYSGWFAHRPSQPRETLARWLDLFGGFANDTPDWQNGEIDRIYLTGLAFDYCVGATALDLARNGFTVSVIEDATRAVAPESAAEMREELLANDIKLINAEQAMEEIS